MLRRGELVKPLVFKLLEKVRIEEKEKEKIEKYQDLIKELQKIWNVGVNIIPLVVGSVGVILK